MPFHFPPARPDGRSLKRLLAGLAAALLLLPVPAMALTFNGSWTAIYSQSGSPTPPKPSFTDSVSGNGSAKAEDFLTVDMDPSGSAYTTTSAAQSQIVLTRTINVTGSQVVKLEDEYTDLFQQAGLNTQVLVSDSRGRTVAAFFQGQSTSSKTLTTLSGDPQIRPTLGAGTYTLKVTVTYNTNNKFSGIAGFAKKSKHQFDFEGF